MLFLELIHFMAAFVHVCVLFKDLWEDGGYFQQDGMEICVQFILWRYCYLLTSNSYNQPLKF